MALLSLRSLPALALLTVLGGATWWVTDAFRDRTRLQGELADSQDDLRETEARLGAAEAELARQAETARIHRAHLDRAADEAREWQALSNDLQQMEGRDAPLSPLLAATADRLWGRDQGAD